MKSIKTIMSLLCLVALPLFASTQVKKVYNPAADAKADVNNAIRLAQAEGKHVFLQIGGNWCPWCIKFHNFVETNSEIKAFMNTNYEVVKVSYDPKNRQEELLAQLGFPQRFGFPVFVVLDGSGKRIHTQNSAFLEKDKSYDQDVVLRFLKNWSPTALNPESYKK